MHRDACRGEGCRDGVDREVCVDAAVRRSWEPVAEPVTLRERERECELVRGPEREATDAHGGGGRGGRDA
jgi:hypothetical protein